MFEITDETNLAPTELTFAAPAGVDIGTLWRVRFNATGPMGGTVGDQPLATRINVEAQYGNAAGDDW